MSMTPSHEAVDLQKFPNGWNVKALGEIVSLYQPQTISAKQFTEAGYPVYGANGVVGNYHSTNHETWQVTVTCRGSTCGTVNRTVDQCWITGNAMVLNCEQNSALDKEFLYQLMLGQDLSDCITGTGQPQIVRSPLAAFRVAFPTTLDEQRAIATALSDVDALIAGLERLIAKKRDIKQAAMQQLLTGQTRLPGFSGEWSNKVLGDLAQFHKGKGLPKSALSAQGAEPCIHYGELFTQYSERIERIISCTDFGIGTFRSKSNDVLMPTSDVTPRGLAKASCVLQDNVILGGDILVIRTNPSETSGVFLSYVIRHKESQVLSLVTGSTVFHLYGSDMRRFEFRVPDSVAEQTAIATVLSDMAADLSALESRLAKIRAIKQGMMQELLTGRTRLV